MLLFSGRLDEARAVVDAALSAARLTGKADDVAGSLLSTGYIAGGTIAGLVFGFLVMSDSVNQALGRWQYRTTPVTKTKTAKPAAATKMASTANSGTILEYLMVPAGMFPRVPTIFMIARIIKTGTANRIGRNLGWLTILANMGGKE
jgi:hypothetical protein